MLEASRIVRLHHCRDGLRIRNRDRKGKAAVQLDLFQEEPDRFCCGDADLGEDTLRRFLQPAVNPGMDHLGTHGLPSHKCASFRVSPLRYDGPHVRRVAPRAGLKFGRVA